MDKQEPHTPFQPVARDFEGHAMPSSVPDGLRLELSRSRIMKGKEGELDEWMSMLNERYDECLAGIPAERAVFEATFRHEEADGSTWIYHLSLMGNEGGGLDESHPVDADHAAYSRTVKEPGWEELQPKFMLTPDHIRQAMIEWGRTGLEGGRSIRASDRGRPKETMPRHYFSPQLHQSAAPFSHYVEHGNIGYTAGIIGQRRDTGELVSDDVSQQCDAMLTNLQILLDEQGLTLNDLLRTTVYLTDYQDFEAINGVYSRRLQEPYPVRTTVQVAALPLGAKVQIESVVAIS